MPAPWLPRLQARVDGRAVELSAVLQEVVDGAARDVGAERATLFLVDRARGSLVSHAAHLPELPRIELGPGEGIAGEVARTGRPVVVDDVTGDRRFSGRVDAQTGFRTRTLAAVPVRGEDGAVLAVLEALNRPGGFGEAEVHTLVALAGEVAGVLAATSLPAAFSPDSTQRPAWAFNLMVGDSAAMREVYQRVRRAAATDATVLVRGETGTGKELVARAIHDNSTRRDAPFVKVDCAALPPSLIENELFGHERGAFTGAESTQDGKVQKAHRGTLFLDEVGDLPPSVQGRLLRLVQERTFFKVGGTREQLADVRFVAATNRPLEDQVADGSLRADLYYRLRVVEIVLPPLRARGRDDLERLVDHFLFRWRRTHRRPGLALSDGARARLLAHDWPGNVRELEHVIEAAVVLAEGPRIEAGELSLGGGDRAGEPSGEAAHGAFGAGVDRLDAVERAYVEWVLAQVGGNRSEAARRLGIGRNTLARILGRAGPSGGS